MYDKPLPVIDGESRPYWDALKQHRLTLKRCHDCGKHHFYPRVLCPHCHSDAVEWVDARVTDRPAVRDTGVAPPRDTGTSTRDVGGG